MIAAEKMEFDGLLRRVSGMRAVPLAVRFAAEGTMGDTQVTLLANGPGPRRAAECRAEGRFDAIVSTGFCGGTHAALRVGDIAAGTEVRGAEQTFRAALPAGAKPAMTGPVVSQDRVAVTVEEKQRLGATGAIAVEMEAASVAAYAEASRTPFYCIRVVSDDVHDAMPLDFNEYRKEDGDFDRGAIALAALRRPFRRIPALRRLQRNCQIASETLGAFLADCRF